MVKHVNQQDIYMDFKGGVLIQRCKCWCLFCCLSNRNVECKLGEGPCDVELQLRHIGTVCTIRVTISEQRCLYELKMQQHASLAGSSVRSVKVTRHFTLGDDAIYILLW